MDNIEKCRKKRATIRTSATKLITKADTIIQSDTKEITGLNEIFEQLSQKESILTSLNSEIENLISVPAEFETEISASEEYSEKIISAKCKIKNCLTYLESVNQVKLTPASFVNNSVSIKLPEILLPKFSGKCEEWSTFKLQFNNVITSNNQLTNAQKLHYLNSALIGEAKNLITLDDTFTSLYTALEERYENKRLIVESHVKSILDIEKLSHESAKDLRNLIDCVKKNIRALTILEYNRNDLSDIFILNIVLQKLDRETRRQYELNISSNDVPKLDDLFSFLEKRAQILENKKSLREVESPSEAISQGSD
ncbi:uncharacterized protein [Parasteatoda tepidariorum]|uniref:uncharacterized protein n=1 Tax=Parasteatoda tepidariorum TaxID=114398 RepID=UPI0039BD8BE7